MYNVKKILVPTDFSDNAATAYNVAHKLASRFEATVDFIHVIQTLQYFNKSIAKLSVPLQTDEDLYPQLQKQAKHKINKLMDNHLKSENKGEDIIQIAPRPSRAVTKHAERVDYDMIVMSTLGEHDSNFLIGSVAEKVIRYSNIPVLSTGTSDFDKIANIVLPTDGSPTSLEALPLAVSIAVTFESAITLFHAHELYGTVASSQKSPYKSHQTGDENIRDVIYAELEELLARSGDQLELRRGDDFESQLVYHEGASSKTIDVNMVIQRGISVHQTITDYAAENADMVVMTTHGRSGLAHVFLGSTAENVARHLTLPVLTVKPDFEEKQQEE